MAFSNEKCYSTTSRAGWPLALRFCNISTNSSRQGQWDSVHMLGCVEDTEDKGYCPEGWDPYGSYCYFVNVDHHVSFNDAVVACQNRTSNLTSIHSREEQLYHMLLYRRNSSDVWIGLHKRNNEQDFEWIDGSPFDYDSWSLNEHDNRDVGDNCVYLNTRGSGNWNDQSCGDLLGYICKKPKGSLITLKESKTYRVISV
ncbi:lithostathine-like [Amphiura filiformis]|uniref:lithostathine-like n=1 Tax=Amphiura filiformis TaxID=82378 RepID=UPI003B224ED4